MDSHLWLKLLSVCLICLSCIAKPIPDQETEFECVPMYKQSALQHPLMKTHKIQTRPSPELLAMLSASDDDTITKIVLKGSKECPRGQVPIFIHPQRSNKAVRLLKESSGDKKEDSIEKKEGSSDKKESSSGKKEGSDVKKEDSPDKSKDSNDKKEASNDKKESSGDKNKDSGDKKEVSDDKKKDTGDKKEGSTDKKEVSNDTKKESGDKKQVSGDKKEESGDKKQVSGDKKEASNDKKKDSGDKKDASNDKKKDSGDKKKKKNNRRTKTENKPTNPALLAQTNAMSNHPPKVIREFNTHYATIRTFKNATKKWRGAEALITITKPRVTQNQYSKSWVWLNYVQDTVTSSIQFGVAVHTTLYPDDRPRLTTYWKSETQKDGCYNALCPGGYVQVHKSIFPGLVYDQVSLPGGKQHTVQLSVAEDPKTKNWVLTIGTMMIGYWPTQTYMKDGASEVFFGGFTGSSVRQTISPPMGFGELPTKDMTQSCTMKHLKYVLPDYEVVDINSNEVETYVDDPKCYGVVNLKYVDYDTREAITFGGPGGYCQS